YAPFQIIHRKLAVKSEYKGLARVVAELPVRGDVHDIVRHPPQLGLETGAAEIIMEQLLPALDLMHCRNLGCDIGQLDVPLYAFRYAEDESRARTRIQRPRFCQVQTRGDRRSITVHQKASAVV